MFNRFYVFLVCLAMLGCQPSYDTAVVPAPLILEFLDGQEVTLGLHSRTYMNPLKEPVDGTIRYASDNEGVATVDSCTGLVTLVSAGTAVITASVAAHEGQAEASTSYTLIIIDVRNLLLAEGVEGTLWKMLGAAPFLYEVRDSLERLAYASSDEGVARVETNTGVVTLAGSGTSLLTAYRTGSLEVVGRCTLHVLKPVLPLLKIYTQEKQSVVSKEYWLNGNVSIQEGIDMTSLGGLQIKGRGNSTWDLMPKKSYTLELNKKQSLLGMPSHKRWVALAEHPDKTLSRTSFALDLGTFVYDALDWTPRSRLVELMINDEYLGVYLIVEQVRVDRNRVDIDVEEGEFLVEINDRFDALYNSWTNRFVYYSFKEPEEPVPEQFERIKALLQEVEDVIYSDSFADPYKGYAHYIDVPSFVDWYLVNEFVKNNDAAFATSVYVYYKEGRLHMGPLWDFDISSGNINYTACSNPEGYWIRNANWISRLFQDTLFEKKVQNRWNEKKAELKLKIGALRTRGDSLSLAAANNFYRWDILDEYVWPNRVVLGSYEAEVVELSNWLEARYAWMDAEINK